MKLKFTERSVAGLVVPAGKAQLVAWDEELVGFGVVVGKATRTFVAEARVDGAKRRVKVGISGRVRDDGRHWTVQLARQRAKEVLGEMAAGIDPNAERRGEGRGDGPTLRDALEAHVARMRKKQRAERSIATLEHEVEKYLPDWLDRPIAELTGGALVQLHEDIKQQARARAGTNPANEKGAAIANRVIAEVSACWNSLNRKLEGALGTWNPAKAVDRDLLAPKRERVADADLPDWHAKVQTLSPVRRDLQLFCMFSAMRSEAARSARWEHVDLKARSLRVPNPKGGEAKAFRLPLGPTLVDILKRRQRENPAEFGPHGGDAGWVFPSLSRAAPFVVQPVAEAKEWRVNPATGKREKYVDGPHVARRTYLSVATECGVAEIDRHVLANHSFARRSVHESYIEQAFPHLLECQATIDRALWARIKPRAKRRRA